MTSVLSVWDPSGASVIASDASATMVAPPKRKTRVDSDGSRAEPLRHQMRRSTLTHTSTCVATRPATSAAGRQERMAAPPGNSMVSGCNHYLGMPSTGSSRVPIVSAWLLRSRSCASCVTAAAAPTPVIPLAWASYASAHVPKHMTGAWVVTTVLKRPQRPTLTAALGITIKSQMSHRKWRFLWIVCIIGHIYNPGTFSIALTL